MYSNADKSRLIELEQRSNRLIVYCPTLVAVNEMTAFLTFRRKIMERVRGKTNITYVNEPCYKPTTAWNAVECPMGFQYMIIEKFRSQYDIAVSGYRAERLTKNCVPDWTRLDPNIQFRANQREILEKMVEADRGRIIVPTAVGKGFIIQQYVTVMPKARIIITTCSIPVLTQLYEGVNKALMGRAGILCGDKAKSRNAGARVVCVSQGKLQTYLREQGEQDVDAIIVDEVHEHGSAQRLELLERVREAKMFGLSANDKRMDGAEFRINGLFGPVLAAMDYKEAAAKELVTPIWVVWCPVKSNTDPAAYCETPAAKERHGVWRYAKRNKAIADAAGLFDGDEQVLITVKTIDHALHLKKLLPDYTVVYAPKDSKGMAKFHYLRLMDSVPKMTKERLDYIKRQFSSGAMKKVIATSVWSRGVDFPGLSVLIRADASNSCISDTQWPGRAARKQGDKTVSLVFDFTDEYNVNFHTKAVQRRKRYAEHQWKQITLGELEKMMQ
jgi:superfamily II DNA or RNA helicase